MDGYGYKLPKELIAQEPAEPRDAARLFVYDTRTDKIALDTFANIAGYLPADSILALNDTKVVPARLQLKKSTGGAVTVLFLFNEWDSGASIKGLPDKGLKEGDKLFIGDIPIVEAVSHANEEFTFKLLVSADKFKELCEAVGHTPLPPYIHSSMNESALRHRYQTAFAANPASVAAPTASLHFTDGVFRSLAAKHVEQARVTLHVGRGTFSPVSEAMKSSGALHAEPIEIGADPARLIKEAKLSGRAVIAAGTTATRLLESLADRILSDEIAANGYRGETRLFIRPPYDFRIVDALITNFHLPGTSLLSLLDAFLQSKNAKKTWRELYARYRRTPPLLFLRRCDVDYIVGDGYNQFLYEYKTHLLLVRLPYHHHAHRLGPFRGHE